MTGSEEARGKIRWILLTGILFCLMLGCTVNVSAKDARSDYSASRLYSYNGHVYQLVYSKLSWTSAESYAETLGGHLATVTTAKEQAFIEKKMKLNESSYTSDYWLGASDSKTEGTWKWVTGEKFKYNNWNSGEPNGGTSENYLEICGISTADGTTYAWNDASGTQRGFIIEWEYGLSVEEKLLTFDAGDTGYINYTLTGGKTASFKSSDTSVAKVSSKGKVIAKGTGLCKITVRYKSASQTVVVVVYPKKVSGLKKQSVTAKMVQLKWTKQSGVTGYQVWMYDPDVEEYVKVKTTSWTAVTVSGLDRNTTYKFKVRAYVKYGSKYYYGSYSKVLTVKTKK